MLFEPGLLFPAAVCHQRKWQSSPRHAQCQPHPHATRMRLLLALAALATLAALAAVNAGPAGEVGDDAGRAGATATVVLTAALAPSEKLLATLVRERLRQGKAMRPKA